MKRPTMRNRHEREVHPGNSGGPGRAYGGAFAHTTPEVEDAPRCLDDSLDENEPEARALLLEHSSVELAERAHLADLIGRHAAAGIRDRQRYSLTRSCERHRDRLPGLRELQRVIHELGHDLARVRFG